MTDTVINIENLSKRYRIGRVQQRHDTLRDALMASLRYPINWFHRKGSESEEQDIIWALKDVSLKVKRGEVVGLIGRNGAGKTTLLKLLSRITKPTEGKAVIKGRVGSLLEIGTGFHPELTGRENIYLSGAIMGMLKTEIEHKFDEIVAFTNIDKFLDTPVKRYSSGMYVRLAFAVAAHLEPEIMLVDEVLAVGDAAFQKKCLGKMSNVAREGRTVLFVSHNMVAIQSLCDRVIWIDQGQLVEDGLPDQVVSHYLQDTSESLKTKQVWDDVQTAPGNAKVRLHRVCIQPINGRPSDPITMKTPLAIVIEFWNLVPDAILHVQLHVYTEQQVVAFSTGALQASVWGGSPLPVGLFRSTGQIPGNLLNSGVHRVLLLLVENRSRIAYRHEDVLSFDVFDEDEREWAWYGREPGAVHPALEWTTELIDHGNI